MSSAADRPVLTVSRLAIGYGQRVLAREISFTLPHGSITCLLGRNGVGKTTLFRTVLGLIAPIDGSIRIGPCEMRDLSRSAIAKAVAYVPQAHVGAFAHSALDLVLMGRTVHLGALQQPGRSDIDIAKDCLAQLGIGDVAEHGLDRISGGQRQLVFIARALAQQAGTLIMDEPAASLDVANRVMLREAIRRLAAEGYAILLSTHEPDEAFATADRAALLGADGFICGPAEAVLTEAALSSLYDRRIVVERTPSGRVVVTAA